MVETKLMDEASVHEWAMRVGSLLEGADAGVAGAGGPAAAEQWARRLGERAARDDALNVGGMLAAAGAPGEQLAATLAGGGAAGADLRGRLDRLESLLKGAPDAVLARSGAARAEHSARALLRELEALVAWLDVPDLDLEPDLGSEPGSQRALALAAALRTALKNTEVKEAAHRLTAVRSRLAALSRAKERLAGALGRHVNNLLIHRGNEAATATAAAAAEPPRHHAELLQYHPFMRWLKEMDEKTYDALLKVYISTWSRVYEREVRAACDAARAQLASSGSGGGSGEEPLDHVLTLVDTICNAEQEFCTQFFYLDVDVKPPVHDGERSSTSGGCAGGGGGEARRGAAGAEGRRVLAELLPALETELVALVTHMDKSDQYGAMRALACISRRVLAPGEGGAPGGGALAAAAVAAKRGADRAVHERVEGMQDAVRHAAKRSRAGIYPFLQEFEELTVACEAMFSRGGRRADVERWYVALADAMLRTVGSASHPRTPRAVLHMENYHRLAAILAALRLPATDAKRVEAQSRYKESLRAYVASSFGRPLDKLNQFFDGVSEAVAAGTKENEVAYRAAFSKQELKRVLALYPKEEVCRSLHALHRTVVKQMSPGSALLQVVWRAMQEEFIQQHQALQTRIAACYPGAGLALPLTIQDILEAFSDIARGN